MPLGVSDHGLPACRKHLHEHSTLGGTRDEMILHALILLWEGSTKVPKHCIIAPSISWVIFMQMAQLVDE